MYTSSKQLRSVLLAATGLATVIITGTSHALGLTSSGSTSFFKVLPDYDLVCKADDGEIDVTANKDPVTGDITFLMESPYNTSGQRVTHTCCEVKHDSGLGVADCDTANPAADCGPCGEAVLEQKVEANTGVPSNCLEETTSGGLETYRCVVTKGAPKEYWVWHLVPVSGPLHDQQCPDSATCPGGCGVVMGTTDNAKPGEYPPYGIVWQYDQYTRDSQVLLADFNGNWCHTGSFCLDDPVTCDVKSAKLDLRTASTASYTIVEVDTVQTFNGNSTNGNVPTDFLSTADAGTLLVDPTEINFAELTINYEPVSASISNTGDRNGDGFDDVRVSISQADFQHALYPTGGCVPDASKAVVFRGVFNDGRAWVGPTTVNVVCN